MIRLPSIMAAAIEEQKRVGIPEPTINDLAGVYDAAPSLLAAELNRVGSYVAYLEYVLAVHESSRAAIHDVIEHTLTIRMASMDPKATIKSKEAEILASDPELSGSVGERITQATAAERIKGMRNAYRAQYDTLSRIISVRQMEAEMARG